MGRARAEVIPGSGLVCVAGCSFIAPSVCPLGDEGNLESCSGFLVGGASACPLVGGAGTWPSDGHGNV